MRKFFGRGLSAVHRLSVGLLPAPSVVTLRMHSSSKSPDPPPPTSSATSAVEADAMQVLRDEMLLMWQRMDQIASSCTKAETTANRLQGGEQNSVPQQLLRAVVKIYSSVSVPNYLIPWQRKLQSSCIGSGFMIDSSRRLVLTNAHVIACATFVELRKHGESQKHTGYVVYVGADCDLALIHVPDEQFWTLKKEITFEGTADDQRGLTGVCEVPPFGGLPALQQSIKAVGYPLGGDQISITSGVVSRIDFSPYGGAENFLMTIQLDAAINPGNSGGPALCGDKVVGVAFQSLISADNIGYIIPNPVIAAFARAFLKDAAHRMLDSVQGKREYHVGFPYLGIVMQEMPNETLRKSVHMQPTQSGALVLDVFPLSNAAGLLKPGDVLLEICGKIVANDLTVEFRAKERIRFSHLVQMQPPNGQVPMRILRDGAEMNVDIPLRNDAKDRLIPNHLFDTKHREAPRFALFGGIVFSTASLPLLMEWGMAEWYNNSPRWLSSLVHSGIPTRERDEVVIVVQVLPHLVNKGYTPESINHRMLTHIEGVAVRNFDHALQLLNALPQQSFESSEDPLVCLTLSSGVVPTRVVLPVMAARKADEDLAKVYRIPVQPQEDTDVSL